MILINGQPENRIPVTDRGLQYGDGLFETLAFRQGQLEWLGPHLARLLLGCERLNLNFSELDQLKLELVTLCAQTAEDSVIKIMLTRGSGGRGYKAPRDVEPTRIISSHPMPTHPDSCQHGVTIRLCQQRLGLNPSLAGIKHLNRLEQVLARSEWDDDNIKEGLMMDINNQLVEGTMSNLFLVKDGELLTPELDTAGIAGIMRAEVMHQAKSAGITCHETRLILDDLYAADEVFLTNSIIDIWPVTALADPQHHWPYGAVTQQLKSALNTSLR